MSRAFTFDVFLSHSSKDKAVVRAVAERLRADGLRVCFDQARIEDGLDRSRVLVLCMSASAFGADWAQLEAGTFRFRDPLDKDRRFIPLRLDDAPVKDSLAQFLYIDWRAQARGKDYGKLLEACRESKAELTEEQKAAGELLQQKVVSLGHAGAIFSVAFSPDGSRALSASADTTLRLWEVETGRCLRVLEGHSESVRSVAWSGDGSRAVSGSDDKTVRMWEVETGRCLQVLDGHSDCVWSVAWSPDGSRALSGSADKTVRLWDLETGRCLRVLVDHAKDVWSVILSGDGTRVLSGSRDKTVRLWEVETGRCLLVLKGHDRGVTSVAYSDDGSFALSGSEDKTVRVWEVKTGRCLRVLEGHSGGVLSVAWSGNGSRVLSGSSDNTVRVWEVETGRCLRVLKGHASRVWSAVWSGDGSRALSGSGDKTVRLWEVETGRCLRVLEGHSNSVNSVAWGGDGSRALSGSYDNTVRVWEVETGRCLRVLEGHSDSVWSVAASGDGSRALSGSGDKTVRLWKVETGRCLRVLEGHSNSVNSVAWSGDGSRALSGSDDHTVRLWEVETGRCLRVLKGHSSIVLSVAWSGDGSRALSGSHDHTVRLWEVETGRCLRVLEGHSNSVNSVAWGGDGSRALSGSYDNTVRVWEVETGRCLRVLEGHSDSVWSVAASGDGSRALSGSGDKTVRLWEVETGRCLRVLEGHSNSVRSVAFSGDGSRAFSGALNGVMRVWDVASSVLRAEPSVSEQVQYTNAKVLFVGESGVGKTGLSNFLAHNIRVEDDKPIPSTDGAWATHWALLHRAGQDTENREIWLWDFAGQVDYRLVHQLFMDNTAAAVLVFNPQNENPFEGLGHWDRDLRKATRKPFAKLLAAGRIDRGGLVVSAAGMDKFIAERGFRGPLHLTSAKTAEGCENLRDAIENAIDWQSIPETTSPALYHRLKQEILNLRDAGVVLIRLAELKQRMEMALPGENFKLEQLEAVVDLLARPGMIQRLDFGGFILLRPEALSRYAAAVVRKVRKHPQELGCIREDEMLAGDLDYQDFERLPREDETVLLRTLHETFISRAWCLRQPSDGGATLTFPSYFRRERPEQVSHPRVLVTYRFNGPAEEIYTTLVVRLHHTAAFETGNLWNLAADFKTQTGKNLGLKLNRESEGSARLEVYFDPDVETDSRVTFLRYVHNHLVEHGQDVVRLRHYACLNRNCRGGQPAIEQTTIEAALASAENEVFCPRCAKPVLLHDLVEQKFESPVVKEQARKMREESQNVIDNESRELILVGHAFAIIAEAGQIYRGYTNSDHGIDGEIEFKDDHGRATGQRLYIQLKSGDAYLKTRQRDNAEIFQIKKPRWPDYWQQQAYPVMLVIRTANGEIRWMEVTSYLQEAQKPVKQIVFEGERFDVMSVRRWRAKALGYQI